MTIPNFKDQDKYKLTLNAFMKHYGHIKTLVEYKFTCRNPKETDFFKYVTINDIQRIVASLLFIEGPSGALFCDHDNFKVNLLKGSFNTWDLTTVGTQEKCSLYEIFLLSQISETYYKNRLGASYYDVRDKGLIDLIDNFLEPLKREGLFSDDRISFSEFGTRRRFSQKYQEMALSRIFDYGKWSTSNIRLAEALNIPCVGTFPHEGPMFYQSFHSIKDSQWRFGYDWKRFYGEENNTFLIDTLGEKQFWHDFVENGMLSFSSFRHDSGDEVEFLVKFHNKLKELGLKNKTIVFSNSLNAERIINIYRKAKEIDFLKNNFLKFAIGGGITAIQGLTAPNIIYKIWTVFPTWGPMFPCKVSFDVGKTQCGDSMTKEFILKNVL